MKKRKGQISTVFSLFSIVFAVAVIAFEIQLAQYDETGRCTEDALAASNLASAVIDIQEYGLTHNLVVEDADRAYQIYRDALRFNLNLDEDFQSDNKNAISGKVEILDYIIYNVRGADVEVISLGGNAYRTIITGGLGSVTAPNGKKIETTSIYSKITFPVEGILNVHAVAVKDKLVDIVGAERSENEGEKG